MADYTVQMTGTEEIPANVLVALGASFQVTANQNIVDQLAVRQLASSADQRLFSFARILEIDSSVSAELNEYEDPASVPLAGARTEFIAKEYGRVVTPTGLADTISGGALARAAAATVGRDAAKYQNLLALGALGAGTNVITDAGNMTRSLMNRAYTRLSIAGATKDALGMYRAVLSPAQIHDLKEDQGAGGWTDVNKYSNPETVLRGEVGSFAGFRIIESSLMPTTGTGASTVYKAVFFGADALAQGNTVAPQLRVTTSDKLARFYNYGWYAVQVYGIIEQAQVLVINTGSSAD